MVRKILDMLVEREKRNRLARELTRLDRGEEQRLAEEGLGDESWPEYREARFIGLDPVRGREWPEG